MKLNFALCGMAKSALAAAAILATGLCYSASPAMAQAQMDVSKYVIGPGDQLQISVWKNPELSTAVPVRPDGRISTPLVTDVTAAGRTPEELGHDIEARLQKMQASAVTAIQESGANMLHLMFGFVEWTDVAGEKTRMAPLVLLPVALSRQTLDTSTHTYPYTVAASGEDWSTNVTLQEMCRKNFGFVLPSVEAEEDLEQYFSRIEEVLRVAANGWTLRRQLTLGLVSFGKILMWRDLDPATWPAQRALLTVPLLRQVLGSEDEEGQDAPHDEMGAPRATEYNIDALPAELRRPPPSTPSRLPQIRSPPLGSCRRSWMSRPPACCSARSRRRSTPESTKSC